MSTSYTVKEVANILGFSTNSIYGFLKDGRIQGIRLGKGRFRIPAEELARVMHLSKNTPPQPQPVQESVPAVPQEAELQTPAVGPYQQQIAEEIPPARIVLTYEAHDAVSLFDWYIAGLAFCVATTLLLYSPTLGVLVALGFGKLLFGTAFVLAGSGLGLVLSDFLAGTKAAARYPLLVSILVCFSIISTVYFQQQSMLYGFLLAGLVISIAVAIITKLKTMVALCISTCIFIVAYPAVIIVQPGYIYFPTVASLGYNARIILASGIAVSWMGLCLAAWATRRSHKILSIILFSTLSLIAFGLSLSLGINLYWPEAIILLWIAIILPLLPYWDFLRFQQGKMRLLLTCAYGLILFVILCSILIIRFMQQSVLDTAKFQLATNAEAGVNIIDRIATTDKNNLTHIIENPSFIHALESNDKESMNGYLRTLLDSRGAIESVQVISTTGGILLSYPQGTHESTDTFGLREYVTKALNTKSFVATAVQSSSQLPIRYLFTYAMPVQNTAHQSIGVLAATSNVAAYALELSKTANADTREQFRIIDESDRWIAHENSDQLLADATQSMDQVGIPMIKYDIDNTLLYIVKDTTILPWHVALIKPVNQILSAIEGYWFLLGGVYLIALFYAVAAGFLTGMYSKAKIPPNAQEEPG